MTTGTTLTRAAARMAKAAALIACGGLAPTSREGVYTATGSTGTVYLTAPGWCASGETRATTRQPRGSP